MAEKQRLIADILNIPYEDFDHIADIAGHRSQQTGGDDDDAEDNSAQDGRQTDGSETATRDAREVLLAALAQGKKTY